MEWMENCSRRAFRKMTETKITEVLCYAAKINLWETVSVGREAGNEEREI